MSDQQLKILILASEVVPFAKTGGLADVTGSLPKALRVLGHDIRVAMPRYGRIQPDKFHLETVLEQFDVPMDHTTEPAGLMQATIGVDVPVYMIDNARYFDRDGIYMYPDDAERFIFFCRGALEMLRQPQLNWQPDIIHCNDWHTAIVPNWLHTIYKDDPLYSRIASVYTIHNLAYQGVFGHRVLEVAGIDEYGFLYHPEMADMAEVVDLMARGIYFADVVNTVSERYAQEILTPEYGERLDPILRDRRDHLFGILNGIDEEVMDPATDTYLASRFDAEHLERRAANKEALQREAGLPVSQTTPLVGVISRLTDQKGFDLISRIIDPLMSFVDLQFVLLGTGDQTYHDMFTAVAQRYPQRAAVFLTFNAALAQRIYGGSDMFLMPSRFEPCGLGQLISMRYGSVPVVRATGGLADTVRDYDPRKDHGNGFAFEAYDSMALFACLVRGTETYKHAEVWRRLVLRCMAEDFSWAKSARKYAELYHRAIAAKIPRESRPLDGYGVSKPPK